MSDFKERVNAHLPIILQLLSTASLVVIALSAICGTNSLKKLAESHVSTPEMIHKMHKSHSSSQ